MWLQNLRTTFSQLQSKLHDCSCIALHLFFLDKLYLATNISQLKGNTSYFWNCTLEEDVHVVIVFDFLDVLHSALTHFNFTSVEYLVKGVVFWKWVSIRCAKDWSIFILTLLMHSRLNHITFGWRFLFLFSSLLTLTARQITSETAEIRSIVL